MAAILLTSPLATAFETALLRASRGQPRSVHVRARRRVRPASLQLAIVVHLGGAAARRRQHRADRLLPRVPGAGPPRVPAPLAVRPQPPVQHAPPRHRDVGAGAGRGRHRVARPARPPRPHLHVRPAGRVHADQRRARQGQVAGERARHRLLLRLADVAARGERLGDQPRPPRLRRRFWASAPPRSGLRLRHRRQERLAGVDPGRLRRRGGRGEGRHRHGSGGRDPDRAPRRSRCARCTARRR